jgi:heme-degrading monooxygenase HmoA
MAIIMISELPGAGLEFADVARQQGLFDQMKSALGFTGHRSGATDSGYRVFEVWESPEAHQAWLDGTVKPSLPRVRNQ